MAKGKTIDEMLLVDVVARLNRATTRSEIGAIMREFCTLTGLGRSAAYKRINEVRAGRSFTDIAKVKQQRRKRLPRHEQEQIEKNAKLLAAIKYQGGDHAKPIPTARCIEIAINMGYDIPEANRSTWDRRLDKLGLNKRCLGMKPAAMRITGKYPGHVYVVDASPADQYYMDLHGNVVAFDSIKGDTHLDDILHRKGLFKIWVYYAIDLHSRTWLARPYAPIARDGRRNGGENANDWIDFLRWLFLPKYNQAQILLSHPHNPLKNCPFEGIPDVLFCDRGSGIGHSSMVNAFARRLGIRIETHLPGNPSAKGMVEQRIGKVKSAFESALNRHIVNDLNQLIYYYQSCAAKHARDMGTWDTWRAASLHHPILRATEQNLADAMTVGYERVVSAYGTVEFQKEQWFISPDERLIGQRVHCYFPPTKGDRRLMVELPNGKIVEATPGLPEHDFDDIKRYAISEGQINRDERRLAAKQIQRLMIFDDILPKDDQKKVVAMPQRARSLETHSPLAPEWIDSIERARLWIFNQTGLLDEEFEPDALQAIDRVLSLSFEQHGRIPGSFVTELSNMIIKRKEKRNGTTID